jgi:hypothetical protein
MCGRTTISCFLFEQIHLIHDLPNIVNIQEKPRLAHAGIDGGLPICIPSYFAKIVTK